MTAPAPGPPLPPPLDAPGVAGQVRVALGRESAELVIRGARLVNVFSEQVEPPGCLAVARGRVVSLGPELPGWIGPHTRVVEAEGLYLLPGLIDAHTHLDSMFLARHYAAWALARGNTTAMSELAMMAGAWGWSGVWAFMDEARSQPMRIFFLAPPLVPPFPDLESSAGLDGHQFQAILDRPDCLGVGETYWTAAIDGDPRVARNLARAQALGKTREGHAAGARKERLMAYAAAGITSCHESTTAREALERLRLGMAVQVRQGFVRKEMDQVVPALAGLPDTRLVMLVTDLAHPRELVERGAMNPLLSKAVELGVAPARAVAWCSLNPARYFNLPHLGALAPGYLADLVLVEDLVEFRAHSVFLAGEQVAHRGRLIRQPPEYQYPPELYRTMLNPPLEPEHLRIPAPGPRARVRVCALAGDTITREEQMDLPVRRGSVRADPGRDVLKLAHLDRRSPRLRLTLGFTSGWGLRQGAFATTLMWDSNNLVVLGASDQDMVAAANQVRGQGGGMAVAAGGRILAQWALPIAGIISPRPLPEMIADMEAVERALRDLGCPLERPLLTAQTLCFTGLPFLRLTDKGLVDVRRRQMVEVLL